MAIDEAVVPEPVACIHPDTLAMLNDVQQGREGGTCWRGSKLKFDESYIPLYGPEVIAYAQQSAEASRVAREELERCRLNLSVTMEELGEMRDERDIAESRLREVETRTVHKCIKLAMGWREVDWPEGFCRRTAEQMTDDLVHRMSALPSSTDTEEK